MITARREEEEEEEENQHILFAFQIMKKKKTKHRKEKEKDEEGGLEEEIIKFNRRKDSDCDIESVMPIVRPLSHDDDLFSVESEKSKKKLKAIFLSP